MPQKVTFRIPDTPQGETITEWLDSLPWGARNRAIVDALYAAATGQRRQDAPQAAVDLAAIRQVVEAAVLTALGSTGAHAQPDEAVRDAVQEAIDKLEIDILQPGVNYKPTD